MGLVTKAEELAKLQVQVKDERFLTKAPAAAIQKVRDRIEKLKQEIDEFVTVVDYECDGCDQRYWKITLGGEEHMTLARKLYEGEWGFTWHAIRTTNEIVCVYPSYWDGSPNGIAVTFTFTTERAFLSAWVHINEYWTDPSYFYPRPPIDPQMSFNFDAVLERSEAISDHQSDPQPTGTAPR
jgi:hypothetical protein